MVPCPTEYVGTPRVSFADSSKALNTRNPQKNADFNVNLLYKI